MISKSILLLLPLLVAVSSVVCKGELLPVSGYIGEHQYKCSYGMGITGAPVENKLYTFGGCYPIPYIVDPLDEPSADDLFGMATIMGMNDRTNISNTIQVYDMEKDEWMLETETKLPSPWTRANIQVVNRDIYAYDVTSRPASPRIAFWKFGTEKNTWTQLDDLPFIWSGILTSCQHDGKIYFSGTEDGEYRNIIHVYDAAQGEWEKERIFLDKKLSEINHMFCGEDFIQFIGKEAKPYDPDQVVWFSADDMDGNVKKTSHGVFPSAYDTGTTIHSHNITGNFLAIKAKEDSLYLYDVGKVNSTIIKLDMNTYENVTLGSFPYTLEMPLLVPYQDDQVFLFGGGVKQGGGFRRHSNKKLVPGVDAIKTYSHKLIVTGGNIRTVDEEAAAVAVGEENSQAKLILQD